MLNIRQRLFFLSLLSILTVKTLEKELGISQDLNDGSNDWSQMKWSSILTSPNSNEFPEDSLNLDVLSSLEKDNDDQEKNTLKLKESEANHFSEDEVFVQEVKTAQRSLVTENSKKDVSNKEKNEEVILNFHSPPSVKNNSEVSSKIPQIVIDDGNDDKSIGSIFQTELSETASRFDNSVVTAGQQMDDLSSRSFIFNPNAEPQQQFQNCTTPKNESGSCRYLQHCLIPTIVSSLNQFMGYVCIIEERFIGVCCPNFPVTVLVIHNEKEQKKSASVLNKECGVGTNRRIVGGSKADPKAWPWMVALLSKFGKRFFCGGALINNQYVLTAAHCTFGISNNEIIARLGEYDLKNDGKSREEYAVTEIKRHGQYNRRSLRNDIALLKLEKPVVFNEFIETICLPEVEKSYVGEEATLAGWGNIAGGGTTSKVLQQASFPVISNAECSLGHGLPILPSLICTNAETGDKGACNGDSGGPLMLLDKNNRWKVIGLVSWGRRGCSPEFPTVYTRVSHFLEWIKKHSR